MSEQSNTSEGEPEEQGGRSVNSPAIATDLCFSTKLWISQWVDEQISLNLYGEVKHYVWFTREFNFQGDPLPCPLELYKLFDTAIRTNNHAHYEIRRRRQTLVNVLLEQLGNSADAIAKARFVQRSAIQYFHPMVWTFPISALNVMDYKEADRAPGEFHTTDYGISSINRGKG